MRLNFILTGRPELGGLRERKRCGTGGYHMSTVQQRDRDRPAGELRLADVGLREVVELVRIDLPDDELEPLLERGVLPGCQLCPIRRSPAGDPIVRIEGNVLALRREMAGCLCVKYASSSTD